MWLIIQVNSSFVCFVVEVCAVLKLDNLYVGQTSWKMLGTQCWSQGFRINLDKVKCFHNSTYIVVLLAMECLVILLFQVYNPVQNELRHCAY